MRAASGRLAEFLDTQDEGAGHTHRGRRHRGGSDAEDRGDAAGFGSRMTRWLGRPGLDAADEDERGPRSGRRTRAAREAGGEEDGRGGATGLDRRFSRFDSNGDGLVDAADFQARASDIAAAAARRFLKRFDRNGDGRVSPEEYAGGAGGTGERFADLVPDGRDLGDAGEPQGGRGRGNVK